MRLRMGAGSAVDSSRSRKLVPNFLSEWKGVSGCEVSALPGVVLSWSPYMIATKRSVVGSGPMRKAAPGKSRPSRYRMKEVFPTEYWPISSTIGLESNHASPSTGSRSRWYSDLRSSGRSFSA